MTASDITPDPDETPIEEYAGPMWLDDTGTVHRDLPPDRSDEPMQPYTGPWPTLAS